MNLSKARWKALPSIGLLLVCQYPAASALEVPAELTDGLGAEEYRSREKAQTELLEWAREQPVVVRTELLRLYRGAKDPEVRHRMLAVLKALVIDEYLKGGSGFIGITMSREFMFVAGEKEPAKGVLVTDVNRGTPAEKAGLQVGDVILGLNGATFNEPTVDVALTEKVKRLKPGTEVTLEILRGGDKIEVKLRLMRKPDELGALNQLDERGFPDIEASEHASKESFFKEWLGRQ